MKLTNMQMVSFAHLSGICSCECIVNLALVDITYESV